MVKKNLTTTTAPEITCRCTVCGSANVEYAVWRNPNNGAVGELFGSWNAGDSMFCADCDVEGRDSNPQLIDIAENPKQFAALQKKRAAYDKKNP